MTENVLYVYKNINVFPISKMHHSTVTYYCFWSQTVLEEILYQHYVHILFKTIFLTDPIAVYQIFALLDLFSVLSWKFLQVFVVLQKVQWFFFGKRCRFVAWVCLQPAKWSTSSREEFGNPKCSQSILLHFNSYMNFSAASLCNMF